MVLSFIHIIYRSVRIFIFMKQKEDIFITKSGVECSKWKHKIK